MLGFLRGMGAGGLLWFLGKVEPGEVTGRREKGGHSSPCGFQVGQGRIAEVVGLDHMQAGDPGLKFLL